MKILRSCQEVTHLLLESDDRPLQGLERASLRMHWLVCNSCRYFRQQHRLMRKALDGWRGYRDGNSDGNSDGNRDGNPPS